MWNYAKKIELQIESHWVAEEQHESPELELQENWVRPRRASADYGVVDINRSLLQKFSQILVLFICLFLLKSGKILNMGWKLFSDMSLETKPCSKLVCVVLLSPLHRFSSSEQTALAMSQHLVELERCLFTKVEHWASTDFLSLRPKISEFQHWASRKGGEEGRKRQYEVDHIEWVVRKQKAQMLVLALLSIFHLVWDSTPWNGVSLTQGGPFLRIDLNEKLLHRLVQQLP